MAWRRPGDKPLSEPMMVRLPTHICVTWPQWVNSFIHGNNECYINKWFQNTLVSLALKAFPQDMQHDIFFKILWTIIQPWFEQVLAHNCYTGRVSDTQGSMHFCSTKISLSPHFRSLRGSKALLYLKSQCHYNMKGLRFGSVWCPRAPR